jgi:hypothetical protein
MIAIGSIVSELLGVVSAFSCVLPVTAGTKLQGGTVLRQSLSRAMKREEHVVIHLPPWNFAFGLTQGVLISADSLICRRARVSPL